MKREQTDLIVTLLLGVLTLIMLVFAFMALTDIYNGESDTAGEWTVVRIFFLSTAFFLFFALKTAYSRLKKIRENTDPSP